MTQTMFGYDSAAKQQKAMREHALKMLVKSRQERVPVTGTRAKTLKRQREDEAAASNISTPAAPPSPTTKPHKRISHAVATTPEAAPSRETSHPTKRRKVPEPEVEKASPAKKVPVLANKDPNVPLKRKRVVTDDDGEEEVPAAKKQQHSLPNNKKRAAADDDEREVPSAKKQKPSINNLADLPPFTRKKEKATSPAPRRPALKAPMEASKIAFTIAATEKTAVAATTTPLSRPAPTKSHKAPVVEDELEEGEIRENLPQVNNNAAAPAPTSASLQVPTKSRKAPEVEQASAQNDEDLPSLKLRPNQLFTYLVSEEYKRNPKRRVNVDLQPDLKTGESDVTCLVKVCRMFPDWAKEASDAWVDNENGTSERQYQMISDISLAGDISQEHLEKLSKKPKFKREVYSNDEKFWELITNPKLQKMVRDGFIVKVLVSPPRVRDPTLLKQRTRMEHAPCKDEKDPSDSFRASKREVMKDALKNAGLVMNTNSITKTKKN